MYTNEVIKGAPVDLDTFVADIVSTVRNVLGDREPLSPMHRERMPAALLDAVMGKQPLSVSIPVQAGGRGMHIRESMRLLAATSYESVQLSMILGINLFLFLQPVVKYAGAEVKAEIFRRFLEDRQMGGFMLTEPDFGADVLNLATSHTETDTCYQISGSKHWQGLTGYAKFWLIAARKKHLSGELAGDIDFFVADGNQSGQRIQVSEYYDSLGLYMLPYGLNQINISVPKHHKLQGQSTGIMMMLDILHNSRLQFPGMAMGFLQRTLDEAVAYTTTRRVGGNSLLTYDNVQYQISRMQAAYTICSAMCVRTCALDSLSRNASEMGLEANTMKALVTDLMHESSQMLLQLSGAKGYRLSQFAGRALIDSRPFQIFEGPNEMLYNQIAESTLRAMKITRQNNLFNHLAQTQPTSQSAKLFRDELHLSIEFSMSQRKKVDLGKIIARVIAAEYVTDLSNKGYRKELIDQAIQLLKQDIATLFSTFQSKQKPAPVADYHIGSCWFNF